MKPFTLKPQKYSIVIDGKKKKVKIVNDSKNQQKGNWKKLIKNIKRVEHEEN